jgi:molybdopterin/thiamine biosynthesis adenylyltransferase
MTSAEKSVVVVGAGNIGSHLIAHLGRMPEVARVTLIDKDVYEPANLTTQDITTREVGKHKADVQARRLKRIKPQLLVVAITDAVERVPLGELRSDMILSCLDSRGARQHVNQFAWRLGVPLIDAGVEAGGSLARINVYSPGAENACLECPWDSRDYEALEQSYPCLGFASNVAATDAPSSLGALAASLQAIECRKLLNGQTERAAIGKQVLIDAAFHKHYVTTFRRNPNCRFSHEVWQIEKLIASPRELTLGRALQLGPASENRDGAFALRVEGKPFVRSLTCVGCGDSRSLLHMECSLADSHRNCAKCGHRLIATGFDLVERLSAASVGREALEASLRKLGLRVGDVFSVGDGECERHYEITAQR